MKNIFDDIRIKYEKPIRLYCDNNFAINIEHNLKHNKTKHIKIDQHFIKEKLESGLITTTHIPLGLQLVDVFTPGLSTE